MIQEKEVEVTLTGSNAKWYKDKGYKIETEQVLCSDGKQYYTRYKSPIMVKVEDLPSHSGAKVTLVCDKCGKERMGHYCDHTTSVEKTGSYYCKECSYEKTKNTMLEKYGEEYCSRIPEFQEKAKQTNKIKYGFENPMMSKEVQDKAIQTRVNKYGFKYTFESPEIQNKRLITMQERYGVSYTFENDELREQAHDTMKELYGYEHALQNPEFLDKCISTWQTNYGVSNPQQNKNIREKTKQTLFNNQTGACSIQQAYLHILFGGDLNYPIGSFNVDICWEEEKIIFEYNGGGHWLSVEHGTQTQEEFDRKELKRFYYIRNKGFKQIFLISRNDKLPSDQMLLQILDLSKQYFQEYPNHSWIEWNIDKSIYRNAENTGGVPFDFGKLRKIKKNEVA